MRSERRSSRIRTRSLRLFGHPVFEVEETVKEPDGIKAELKGDRSVVLTYPGGDTETITSNVPVPKQVIDKTEIAALITTKLALNDAFSDERSGVDQVGFVTQEDAEVPDLPENNRQHYKDALEWAGNYLKAIKTKGKPKWTPETIAEYWVGSNKFASNFPEEDKLRATYRLANTLREFFN
ncbi:MAG TPA: hypothetical protein VI819_00110 [Patescibacteria group bacterium]|nr:hypothetical protein [Patescibacteria group bacterium]